MIADEFKKTRRTIKKAIVEMNNEYKKFTLKTEQTILCIKYNNGKITSSDMINRPFKLGCVVVNDTNDIKNIMMAGK